jgi:hypothetical protein
VWHLQQPSRGEQGAPFAPADVQSSLTPLTTTSSQASSHHNTLLTCAPHSLTCYACVCNTASGLQSSGKDVKGAGASFISPGWLTALQRNWGDAASAVRGPVALTGALRPGGASKK